MKTKLLVRPPGRSLPTPGLNSFYHSAIYKHELFTSKHSFDFYTTSLSFTIQ